MWHLEITNVITELLPQIFWESGTKYSLYKTLRIKIYIFFLFVVHPGIGPMGPRMGPGGPRMPGPMNPVSGIFHQWL